MASCLTDCAQTDEADERDDGGDDGEDDADDVMSTMAAEEAEYYGVDDWRNDDVVAVVVVVAFRIGWASDVAVAADEAVVDYDDDDTNVLAAVVVASWMGVDDERQSPADAAVDRHCLVD